MSSYTDSDSAFDDADDRDLGDWDDEVLAPGGAAPGGMQYAGAEGDEGSAGATFRALFAQDGQLATFSTPEEALRHAKELGCDFVQVVRRCALNPLAVIRLLNHLRRAALQPERIAGAAPTPASVQALTGDEPFLHDDAELAPVPGAEMDGLLQVDFDAFAADSETAEQASARGAAARIAELESLLHASQLACADLRERFTRTAGMAGVGDEQPGALAGTSAASALRGSARLAPARDDDTHYFTSYAGHDIHQTMISDVSRTLSYARFLLHPRNAALIRGKVVMDVGCGSGILSLFAARAGAKKVIAIDASDVAHRAAANVKDNGMDGIVEVVKGKVEELDERLKEYHGKVDLLVSEWMGYFLLYESMLPSVLHARNLYLAPTGVLAPSHCRMTLAALSDAELVDLRLHFWNDVHGFSMTKMGKGLDDEAWSESVTGDKVVSSVATIYDLPLQSMAARQPNFVSPFSIVCNKQTTVHALISWFDTWFTPTGRPFPSEGRKELPGGEELPGLPPCDLRCPTPADVRGLDLRGSAQVDPATDEEGGETVSFTTGPHGKETHWKQTLFVLKEPIEAQDGTTITGKIHVTTASDNSRELDVELHYEVLAPGAPERASGKQQVGVQTVQLFAVR